MRERPKSPTGNNNLIKLRVEFAADPNQVNTSRIDALFDWAEGEYFNLFPNHQTSISILGYFVRCYSNNVCVGTKDGFIWLYMNNESYSN